MTSRLNTATARIEPYAHAALRIVAGALFTVHGTQKIFGWLAKNPPPAVGTQLWFGGLIELVCGVLIAVGLLARPAAFLAAGMMAVAYFQFHWKLVLTGWRWLPSVNGGEMAVLYCFVFLVIAARGAGPLSLDQLRRRG